MQRPGMCQTRHHAHEPQQNATVTPPFRITPDSGAYLLAQAPGCARRQFGMRTNGLVVFLEFAWQTVFIVNFNMMEELCAEHFPWA